MTLSSALFRGLILRAFTAVVMFLSSKMSIWFFSVYSVSFTDFTSCCRGLLIFPSFPLHMRWPQCVFITAAVRSIRSFWGHLGASLCSWSSSVPSRFLVPCVLGLRWPSPWVGNPQHHSGWDSGGAAQRRKSVDPGELAWPLSWGHPSLLGGAGSSPALWSRGRLTTECCADPDCDRPPPTPPVERRAPQDCRDCKSRLPTALPSTPHWPGAEVCARPGSERTCSLLGWHHPGRSVGPSPGGWRPLGSPFSPCWQEGRKPRGLFSGVWLEQDAYCLDAFCLRRLPLSCTFD